MTGSPHFKKAQQIDPSPTPLIMEEIEEAKTKVKGKKGGRRRNILAGLMMAGRKGILDTRFKTKLGE